jgi:hypothetical protein
MLLKSFTQNRTGRTAINRMKVSANLPGSVANMLLNKTCSSSAFKFDGLPMKYRVGTLTATTRVVAAVQRDTCS